jgi:cyclopropane-fatty-acyl-phospholipid synthase
MQRVIAVDRRPPSSPSESFRPPRKLLGWREYFNSKARLQKILANAGITVNGTHPCDPIIKDGRFFGRVLHSGSIGLGDSYLDGWWECKDLGEFFYRILLSGLGERRQPRWQRITNYVAKCVSNGQSRMQSREVAEKHYDLGNTLYQRMLDGRMVYTCARWNHASNLDAAQEEKLHVVCESLALEPEMRLLDVGCGWGSLARFAAVKYGATVVGVTVSQQQLEFARRRCEGLPVELYLQDYRDVQGTFDRIASLGMFEHVGVKNYRLYFEIAHRLLKPDGLFYLGTIGSAGPLHEDDPWMLKHIFPNSHIPSWPEIESAIRGLFSVERVEDWGEDYGRTVMAWLQNFEKNWSELRDQYGERFHRMWRYYLLGAEAAFRAKGTQAWQILLCPD